MATQELKGKKNKWLYIDEVSAEVEEFLKEQYKFHPLDIEDVMSERQRPKIEIYKYYIFLICVFPYYDQAARKMRGRELNIFITDDALITVAKKPYPLLQDIFNKVSQSSKLQKMWLDKGTSFLLYKILESLYRDSNSAVDQVGKFISDVEDDVYENELKSVAHNLASIRRGVLALKRMIDPQRSTINTLVHVKRNFIAEEMELYFDNIHDDIEKMWVVIENCKDTVEGLHLTNESLISQYTNRIITILTVISVSLMPLTLLSGIYGMNLVRLPYADRPIVIFGMFLAVVIMVVVVIIYIYRQTNYRK